MKTLLIIAIVLTGSLMASPNEHRDDNYRSSSYYENERGEYRDRDDRKGYSKVGVAPIRNAFYKIECGSCHFAYQPGLLPEKSWVKLMSNLENHFQTDASLEAEENKRILNYLVYNSAEKFRDYKISRKIDDSIRRDETPIAVSDTRYFKKEHRKLRRDMVEQKEVKSIANCMACHKTADKGSYEERYINIPNYGKYEND
ncbi:MAG: diheme cytochrome c [Sulfurimonas sp.]|nr:diheme cytochrome c [Sulfurimonas sp.]